MPDLNKSSTVGEVAVWLANLGLNDPKTAQAVVDNAVDGELMMTLTDKDLETELCEQQAPATSSPVALLTCVTHTRTYSHLKAITAEEGAAASPRL